MSIYLYSAFVLACAALAITPGPNMALFISNTATYGMRPALLTVAGSTTSLTILTAIAALGMTSIMIFVAEWFDVIRWVGAAYLVWLGFTRIRAALRERADYKLAATAPPPRGRWFWQGMAATLVNPKVLLFLGAFFPQFIDPAAPVAQQLAILAATFVIVVGASDALVVLAFSTAKGLLKGEKRRFTEGFTGLLLVCGGLYLATMKRA